MLADPAEKFLYTEVPQSADASENFAESNESDTSSLVLEAGNVLSMSGFSPYTTSISTTQPEIITNIQNLPIETEIISKAIEIYYQTIVKKNPNDRIVKSFKGTRKIRLLFYCVFAAYHAVDYSVDPCYVAEIVKLPANEIDQAINDYVPPGVMLIEPEKMMRFYIARINRLLASTNIHYNEDVIVAGTQNILKVCRSTAVGREWIQNTTAKSVAIAALYFYMNDTRGFGINQAIIERACYLSWACIRRHYEQVAKYYNCTQRDHKQREITWDF